MVIDLKRRGTVVIFSTHQMNDVEELCDRVFMIDKGRAVLYGGVTEVRQRYRSNSVFVRWDGPLNEVRGVSRWEDRGQFHEAFLEDGVVPEDVLKEMLRLGGSISMFQLSTPRLHDIFLRIVRDGAIV
jgi:ABC-2 type transport system ATP-binding protein